MEFAHCLTLTYTGTYAVTVDKQVTENFFFFVIIYSDLSAD